MSIQIPLLDQPHLLPWLDLPRHEVRLQALVCLNLEPLVIPVTKRRWLLIAVGGPIVVQGKIIP